MEGKKAICIADMLQEPKKTEEATGEVNTLIQWHPGFVAAMNLEFRGNREELVYEREFNLNTKPLSVDLLILKKDPKAMIANEIGRIFRRHNLIEYKSEGDHLDIDVFYKVGGYASLYKAYGERVNAIPAEDVTVSFVRQAKPVKLLKELIRQGAEVSNPYQGIYYIQGPVLFATQIIVVRELDKKMHVWLGALSGELGKKDMETVILHVSRLQGKMEKEFADSVLQVSMAANRKLVDELKGGDEKMCQVLLEIMEPELRQSRENGREEGRIREYIELRREDGYSEERIASGLRERFGLTEEQTAEYMCASDSL